MEWLREFLKSAGMEVGQVDNLIGEVKKEMPKHFVPKEQYNDVAEARKQAEKDRDAFNDQLEELRKSAGASEELKEQISKLQEENKAVKERHEADFAELKLDTAIKLAIGSQVHDAKYAIDHLDKSKIELNEDGSVKGGLEDQVKLLQESKAFLFVQKEEGKPAFKGAKPAEGTPGSQNKDEKPSYGRQAAQAKTIDSKSLNDARESYFK